MAIRVLLADDHEVVRGGLRALLTAQPDIEVVADAGDGRSAMSLTRKHRPDVLVMDISMPDCNGVAATRQITAEVEGVRVLALSVHTGRQFVARMLDAGAAGYLPKICAPDELVRAVREVHGGGTYLSPRIAGAVVEGFLDGKSHRSISPSPLTEREREVLQLVAEGRSSKEVASALHLSARTVESHRRSIMDKLSLHSVAELTKYAIREGLTTADI